MGRHCYNFGYLLADVQRCDTNCYNREFFLFCEEHVVDTVNFSEVGTGAINDCESRVIFTM